MTKQQITVGQVQNLMNQAAKKFNLVDYRELHRLFGVNERNFRKWRNRADDCPDAPSAIPGRPLAYLKTLASGKCEFEPIPGVDWSKIPEQYITNAENFECPPVSVLELIVGRKGDGLIGLTRKELGRRLGLNWKKFSDDLNSGSISFSTWAAILLLCGVPYTKVFYL